MSPEEYLQQRVENQIEWFSRKSRQNNSNYLSLQVASIFLSVTIPFAANFMSEIGSWGTWIVSGMGVAIALISGLLALMKYRDNWIEYRATTEMLKRERFMYLTRAGAYAGSDHFTIFVQRIEEILAQEVSNWKSYRFSEKANEQSNPGPT